MKAGVKFPPVVVYYDGENYWLADGFHRLKAAYGAGFDTIECEVRQGTLNDAQWHSFRANKTNGLRRTKKDKQRAVKAALQHSNAQDLSDGQLAKHLGVSRDTVWRHRKEITCRNPTSQPPLRTGRDGRRINTKRIGGRKRKGKGETTPPAPRSSKTAEKLPVPAPPEAPTALPVPPAPTVPQAVVTSPAVVKPGPDAAEWGMRIFRACKEIADCPVSAKTVAALLGRTENRDRFFSHLENAHEFLTEIAHII
jgi:hypothetical protein